MMNVPKAATPSKGRSPRWFRGCLFTFVFGLLMVFLMSSLGIVTLLRGIV